MKRHRGPRFQHEQGERRRRDGLRVSQPSHRYPSHTHSGVLFRTVAHTACCVCPAGVIDTWIRRPWDELCQPGFNLWQQAPGYASHPSLRMRAVCWLALPTRTNLTTPLIYSAALCQSCSYSSFSHRAAVCGRDPRHELTPEVV